jgi:predicted membrane protein
MLMLLATVGTTVGGPVAQHQGWGRAVAYTSVAQLATGDQQKLGRLRVDLTGLAPTADASYTAHVGMGDLEVTTPRNYNVVINWRVKSGAFVLDDQEARGGSDQSGRVEPAARDPRKRTLTVNLSVDHGVVQVRR